MQAIIKPMIQAPANGHDAGPALRDASRRLLDFQHQNGGWEGEMTWCPMLTAQLVFVLHLVERPVDPQRRRHVLRYFARARVEGGLWALHEGGAPHLFVTTLVYVAARLLGAERDDPLVAPARRFLHAEGVVNIPSWGKFWLALLNLYDWRGVHPAVPELWSLPRWLPLHPSKWYCHARLIYMPMAVIYAHRHQAPVDPSIAALRDELFPDGFAHVDFAGSRNRLREADLYARPGVGMRAAYALARRFERFHGSRLRARSLATILRHIRWELQGTSHASISPLNGFLNIIALWLHDPDDSDVRKALAELDRWIWQDAEGGARVALQRSASWDTAFALQALGTAPGPAGVGQALERGADFLRRQQLGAGLPEYGDAYRTDPRGGWCFAGGWHGWPVSDCTAEAMLGLMAANGDAADEAAMRDAVRFILLRQNRDGAFGSYEARRSRVPLEWLNSSEMFADAMTEQSYVECTASCLSALAAYRERCPECAGRAEERAISRAGAWLRRSQAADGAWRGVWGVQFIYGTYFGVRGLVAAGARPADPALRLACGWLLDRQRGDGGWGEHHGGCRTGTYVPHEESQVIQTAWALIALLEAGEPDWPAISRGIRCLLDMQEANGGWPTQDLAGAFFRTALSHYALYRLYFPLQALGLYERRRQARRGLATPSLGAASASPTFSPGR